ncbi:antibiotic biosynthesis monooxygenase family protein [Kocuria sabuli]|uniref:antibiotic biosynthesis monooxygenase family protein n=1 Tax=Kocuria sabuli TaxID=3071448 RepID=UPI0034D7990C
MKPVRPPCTAVIFSSQRSASAPGDGYDETAQRMEELARQQPGFLSVESARNADGFGITVSYWETAQHARAWKQVTEHLEAQHRGARDWYADYTVRVATVERQYGSAGQR